VASTSARSSAPRSLADELRGWSDEALADLLLLRPDLAAPAPPDLGALAVSAASRLSVQRAIDGLDACTLQVLEVLVALPEGASAAQVGKAWGGPAKDGLDRLRALALIWGSTRSIRLVRTARDLTGTYPAGLGPPLADALGRRSPRRLAEVMEDLGLPPAGDPEQALARLAEHLGDPLTVARLVDQAPQAARTVLERLTWGPPIGKLDDADRPVRAGQAGSPIEWLLARGLLAVADAGHVVLPREIALALRGGRVHRRRELVPPSLALRDRPAAQVDGTAAQLALEALRLVDELGQVWTAMPPAVMRAGGLGVRELRRTAAALETDERTAALVIEVAFAAGLVASDAEADPVWLPSLAYDLWRTAAVGERWTQLCRAWLDSPRAAGLIGSRGPKDVLVAALGPDVERAQAAQVRGQVLGELATTTKALDDAEGSSLLGRLDWAAPRRAGRIRAELVAWTLREAAWLGITGLGALSGPGRLLLAGDPGAAAALEASLPAAVDHVLLQADLTAVAPGRLEPDLELRLAEMANVESRGGATVYRFDATTVRRALDAGRTADDLTSWLTRHSRTPVPQPLTYLISDSARRHGRLRVGTASSYLRAEDESALAELLADRRTAVLRLRRLAPTVLAAQAAPDVVLKLLRELGLSPAAEGPEGDLLIRRQPARRSRGGGSDRTLRRTQPPSLTRENLLPAIRTMRALDEHARHPRRTIPDDDGPPLEPMDPAGALAVIREAVALRQDVWIGYLEDAGRPVRRMVEPLSVEAGRVRALERSTGKVRNYSVHRLIAVASATGGPPASGAAADAAEREVTS
jgi:Helicase conserved C-terminal domain